MELNKMINPSSHKTSFDIRLPPDPKSSCNKFITKGYSMSLCILNITIKIGLTIGLLIILLHQIKPDKIINEFSKKTFPQKFINRLNMYINVFKEMVTVHYID